VKKSATSSVEISREDAAKFIKKSALLFERKNFEEIVHNVLADFPSVDSIENSAIVLLQEASEKFLEEEFFLCSQLSDNAKMYEVQHSVFHDFIQSE